MLRVDVLEKDEQALVKRYQKQGDEKAGLQLINKYDRYLWSLVHPRARQYPSIDLEDLHSAAVTGFLCGLQSFDLKRNVQITTYTHKWIKQEIDHCILALQGSLKVPTNSVSKRIFFQTRRLSRKIQENCPGQSPEVQFNYAASVIKATPEMVKHVFEAAQSSSYSLDDRTQNGELFKDALPSDQLSPEDALIKREDGQHRHDIANEALQSLGEQEAEIISARHFCSDKKRLPLRVLSEQYKIAIETVRKIEIGAIKKMAIHAKCDPRF